MMTWPGQSLLCLDPHATIAAAPVDSERKNHGQKLTDRGYHCLPISSP